MKRALIIAVNAYPDPYKLRDSLNDKDDLAATLAGKGFAVTSIIDAQATRANVLAGYRSMVSNTNPGDSIVLAFMGLGSTGLMALLSAYVQSMSSREGLSRTMSWRAFWQA